MRDPGPVDDGQEYPLADMLGELASQLEVANQRVVQAQRPGRLRWTEATVELGVTWEKKGDGGIDLKVVRLGGGLTKANTTTIAIKVVPIGLADAALRSPAEDRTAVGYQDLIPVRRGGDLKEGPPPGPSPGPSGPGPRPGPGSSWG
jgi:hypothetical protein